MIQAGMVLASEDYLLFSLPTSAGLGWTPHLLLQVMEPQTSLKEDFFVHIRKVQGYHGFRHRCIQELNDVNMSLPPFIPHLCFPFHCLHSEAGSSHEVTKMSSASVLPACNPRERRAPFSLTTPAKFSSCLSLVHFGSHAFPEPITLAWGMQNSRWGQCIHSWSRNGESPSPGPHLLRRGERPPQKHCQHRLSIIFLPRSNDIGWGFPAGHQESVCQCRRHRRRGFDPWVRKIPWRREMATRSSILAWEIPWTEQL